jgi:hypothetical protein
MRACLPVPLLGWRYAVALAAQLSNDAVLDFQLRPDGSGGAVRGFERELAMVSTWPQR